jgi:hypothetical protein
MARTVHWSGIISVTRNNKREKEEKETQDEDEEEDEDGFQLNFKSLQICMRMLYVCIHKYMFCCFSLLMFSCSLSVWSFAEHHHVWFFSFFCRGSGGFRVRIQARATGFLPD